MHDRIGLQFYLIMGACVAVMLMLGACASERRDDGFTPAQWGAIAKCVGDKRCYK